MGEFSSTIPKRQLIEQQVTGQIIGAAIEVHQPWDQAFQHRRIEPVFVRNYNCAELRVRLKDHYRSNTRGSDLIAGIALI